MSSSQSPTRNRVAAAATLRRARPTTARGPRFGVLGSVLFHGLIVAAAMFTFHRNFETPEDSHVVPVDLVTIADQTNVAAQAPPAPEPQKIDTPPPAIEAPPEPQLQEVEPAPEPPVPKFDVQKEKPPPVDKPPTKKEMQQDFNALLNKLTAPQKPVKTAKEGPRVIQGVGAGNLMTASLADFMKTAIRPCWSPNVAAPNPNDMVVDFDLVLNQDGTIASIALTRGSQVAAAGNSYTQASASAASRAIYQCQPYKLPANQYTTWHEMTLHFDPRQMMEQ